MEIVFYLLKVTAYTVLLWLGYRAFLSRNSFHRFSRLYLLAAMLVPFLLPLAQFRSATISSSNAIIASLPEMVVNGKETISRAAIFDTGCTSVLYIIIAGFMLGRLLMKHFSFRQKLKQYACLEEGDYQLFIDTGMGPGSYGTKVFVPAGVDTQILAHELAHIQCKHHYDLLLIQLLKVICWPNIFLHFIAKDLKLVHEYEADELAAKDNDVNYIKTLLSEIFGVQYPAISHSFFHHPIKNRIMMLQKRSSKKKRIVVAITGIAAIGILVGGATWLQSCSKAKNEVKSYDLMNAVPKDAKDVKRLTPKVIQYRDKNGRSGLVVDDRDHELADQMKDLESNKGRKDGVYNYVDNMPEFKNGDVSTWLANNTNYPVAARNANKEGRIIVQFVVDENGKIENVGIGRSSKVASLDAEAMRVVKMMPDWKPGTLKGKPVKVQFSLPITFKLD